RMPPRWRSGELPPSGAPGANPKAGRSPAMMKKGTSLSAEPAGTSPAPAERPPQFPPDAERRERNSGRRQSIASSSISLPAHGNSARLQVSSAVISRLLRVRNLDGRCGCLKLRQTVANLVIVALIGHEDVAFALETGWLVESSRHDGNAVKIVVFPKQNGAANPAESALCGSGGRIPL